MKSYQQKKNCMIGITHEHYFRPNFHLKIRMKKKIMFVFLFIYLRVLNYEKRMIFLHLGKIMDFFFCIPKNKDCLIKSEFRRQF